MTLLPKPSRKVTKLKSGSIFKSVVLQSEAFDYFQTRAKKMTRFKKTVKRLVIFKA